MATERQPQFEGRGDLDLLHLMAVGDALAFDAWEEFYTRHGGYLLGICTKAFTARVGVHRIQDIVQDTLVKAFQKAATLEGEANLDADSQRRLVRGWLGTICQNIVSDYFRGQPEVDFVDSDLLDAHEAADSSQTDPGDEVDCPLTRRLQLMEAALETLTDREQEVLRTTMMWYKPDQKVQKLPHSVMTDLTTSLKTSPDNVRKIRERGMTKLKSYIESHEHSTEE
jgi:RNA polymerase sigma factor (sigma-70 family)